MTVLGFHSMPELAMFATSLLTGLTMVMGVNAVNSAPSFMLNFYQYIRKDPDAVAQFPSFWSNVLNFYTVITLVAQTLHEPTNLTSFLCRFSLLFRLEASSVLMLVELLVIVLLPHTGASEAGAMAAIIVVAYLGGAARAYFENTGYAMFGPCPSKMLSGMLVGSALSGALVSVIQIILMAVMPNTHESVLRQSILYFSLSLGIIFLAALSLIGLLFNPFAKKYIAEFRSRRSPLANIYRPLHDSEKQKYFSHDTDQATAGDRDGDHGGELTATDTPARLLSKDATADRNAASGAVEDEDRQQRPAVHIHRSDIVDDEDVLFDDRVPAREEGGRAPAAATASSTAGALSDGPEPYYPEEGEDSHLERKLAAVEAGGQAQTLTTSELLQGVRLWPVIKRIYPMMISCLLTFLITYLMYPGILLAVDADDGWYTTLIMAVYNFGDFAGRSVSMWKRLWLPRKAILIGSIARVAFVPLLVLCAVGKIPGHAPAYVFTALLAVSNGFFGTLSMVYAPETPSLSTDGERAIAGQAIGVCLLLGCSIGSLIQLAEVLPFN